MNKLPKQHYRLLNIEDTILVDSGERIRLLGRILSYDVDSNVAVIDWGGKEFTVFTSNMTQGKFRIGTLYMWMGILKRNGSVPASETLSASEVPLFLEGVLIQDMSTLNTKLFNKCVAVKNAFLNSLETQ